MFVNNIDPVLLHLGPFEIRYYGIIFAVGFLLVYWYLEHQSRKGKTELSNDEIGDLIIYLIAGVVLGARAFAVFVWEPGYYLSNPSQILAVWKGGLSFHGGLIGAGIAAWLFCKKKKKNIAKLADLVIIPGVFALALGRIANFFNSEHLGYATNAPWCVVYERADNICRHPVQLYGALKRFAVFGILLLLDRKEHKDGFLFWVTLLLFGAGRLFIDFFRTDARFFGLSTGQYLSLAMFAASAVVLSSRYWKDLKTIFLKRQHS